MKLWDLNQDTGEWSSSGEIAGPSVKPGEVWALALSEDGSYLASTTNDGRINVWQIKGESTTKIQEYETGSAGSGSFGMSVDLSRDGKYTASGHQNGAVYIFNNDTGRILYSLSGMVSGAVTRKTNRLKDVAGAVQTKKETRQESIRLTTAAYGRFGKASSIRGIFAC